MPTKEEILGNRLYNLISEHQRTASGCECGAGPILWNYEHREHVARVIARELSTNGD